jgi:hypothetical protein
MSQIRLGDLLVRAQVVSEAQLNAALAEQKQWGGRLGSILVRMGVLSEDLLVKALAKQLNLPRAPLGPTDPLQIPDAIRSRVDRATCERLLMLPIGWVQERRAVVVAVADPLNVVAIDDFSRRIGARVELMVAPETQLLQAIARVFTGAGGVDHRVTGAEEGLAFMDNAGRMMTQSPRLAAQTTTPAPTTPTWTTPPTAPPQPAWTTPPTAPPQPAWTTPPTAPPQPAWTTPPTAGAGADDLRVLAEQQLKAVRALVELLIERGVVSRAELQAWLGR